MNRNIPNVTSLVIQRETHSNRRQNGLANRDLLACAEEKAASCEMEEISCQLPENTRSTFLVTFSPDGTKVASAHGNHKIYVSDVRTGKCLHTLEGHPRTPWCIAFHPSYNDILASGCLGGEVRVWDLHGGCEIWVGERNCVIASLTFHPSDQVLVIATTNMIYFWNWSQSQPFARCKTASEKERVRFVRFGPYGHKLFTGIANVSSIMREPDENSLNERLFILNDQHQQLLQRLQELQSRATGTREEQLLTMTSSGSTEQPRSSAIAEALRMAREYAGDISQTAQQPQRNSMQAPFGSYPVDGERSRRHSASRPDTQTNDVRDHHQLLRNQNTTRLSFRDLQQNLRSMRIRYTRICERLQQLLQIRRWSSINSLNESVSDVNLVYSLLTFWREYETLAISLQHSTLHGYDANRESDSDARRHIAVAMVSLLQLQDMLHTSILQQINDVSDRGMARLIHSILMTLHELATLDTNILALRTTALEAIGMHAQWTSSIQRPEARRQRGPISSMSSSSENPSLTGASFLNSMSRPSNISSSTTHQLASFRQIPHSDTLGNNGQNSGIESAFSQPERSSTSARNPVGSGSYFRDVASRTNSSNITQNLSLHNRVGERFCATSGGSASTSNGHSQDSNSNVRHENTGLRFGGVRNSRFAEPSSFQEPQSNMSNTERLLGSILEELLNLLVPTNSNLNASTSSDVQNNSSSPFTANFSNTGHPSRMSPVSWYSYWWNHFPNIRSASGLHSGLMEPNLATRATYRIQYWDFTRFQIPDISSAQINIVVPECLIQNDANIEISADGRLLATLVPSNIATSTLLAVHSLQPDTFGQCLYLWSFSSSVISISLSPLGRYVLVGLGSNRRSSANHGDKLIIGQVLQMVEGKEDKNELQHVRTVELRGENRFDVSLNSMKWLPLPGQGLVYGTNRGDLRICRPRSCTDVWVKPKIQQSVAGPLRMYREILARVLARRSGSSHSNPVTRLVFPTMNTTGTQTESDSDSG